MACLPATATVPDTQLLDATWLPPAPGLEPAIALFGAVELSPGEWRRAEEALQVPETARRLTICVGDPANPRFTQARCLHVAEAVPYLISLARTDTRASVKSWVLASVVAQRIHEGTMRPRGEAETDAMVERLAGAMPESARAVLVDEPDESDLVGQLTAGATGEDPELARVGAVEAMTGFLDIASRAIALGPDPSRTPSKRGRSRTLAGLVLQLAMPRGRDGRWVLHARAATEGDTVAPASAPKLDVHQLREKIVEAGRTFGPLQRLAAASVGEPLELATEEASAFIMASGDLQAMGSAIALPEELAGSLDRELDATLSFRDAPDERAAPRSSSAARGGQPTRFHLDDLVAWDLDVALGGEQVDADELRRLARDAGALVRVGDSWVALDASSRDRLERLARAVEAQDATMASSRALAAALGGTAQLPGGIEARVRSVHAQLLERAVAFLRDPGSFPEIDVPAGFTGELRGYQRAGLNWLAGMASLPLGGVLADDMGLGKTVQVIALLAHMHERAKAVDTQLGPALVVCPTSLIGNWERELNRFAPDLTVHVHHGPGRAARASQMEADVVVTSYGLVARDRELLGDIAWHLVAFDEAQAVKNPDTEQARAARTIHATVRLALTGTPMENRLLELWAILDLVNPGLMGTAADFARRYAGPIERAGDEEATRRLRSITRPFLLRRVKHDPRIVPDLPEKSEHTVHATLTPEQAALYRATVDAAMSDVRQRDGIGRRGAVLALLTRLKQACNHPMQLLGHAPGEPVGGEDGDGQVPVIGGRSGKLERLESMLQEVVAEGDRALVFTQYAQMGHILDAHLPDVLGCDVLYLHGGVSRTRREELVQRFQADNDADPAVFILSLRAGGLGLNLMNAAHVFHYDRWWNPAVEDQATDRTHRIGQTRAIQVHKLVCAGTLEERIAQVIDDKRDLAGRVIDVADGGEKWVTELGDEELEELVALSSSAVAEPGE